MNLNEWQGRNPSGRPSAVDLLPEAVREQLIEARRSGTHSVPSMVAWLRAEGFDAVTVAGLYQYFRNRNIGNRDTSPA